MHRVLIALLALALVTAACGDDSSATTTTAASDSTADALVTIPDVVGGTVEVASNVLESVGLVPDVVEVAEDGAEPGTVVEQIPAGGTQIEAGATVAIRVVVADSPETTTTTAAEETTTSTTAVTTTTEGTTTTTEAGDEIPPEVSDRIIAGEPIYPGDCAGQNTQASAYITAEDPSGVGFVQLTWEFQDFGGQGAFDADIEDNGDGTYQLIGHIADVPDPWTGGGGNDAQATTVQIRWLIRDDAGNGRSAIDEFVLSRCP